MMFLRGQGPVRLDNLQYIPTQGRPGAEARDVFAVGPGIPCGKARSPIETNCD